MVVWRGHLNSQHRHASREWGRSGVALGLASPASRRTTRNEIELTVISSGWCLCRRLEDRRCPHRAYQAPDPEPGMLSFFSLSRPRFPIPTQTCPDTLHRDVCQLHHQLNRDLSTAFFPMIPLSKALHGQHALARRPLTLEGIVKTLYRVCCHLTLRLVNRR